MKTKKILMTFILTMVFMLPLATTFAKETDNAHWQVLATTKAATFTYDENSLRPIPANVKPQDIVIMDAQAAAYIDDGNFLGLLGDSLQKKLKNGDKLKKVFLRMNLNLNDHSYKIIEAKIFTDRDKQIEKRKFASKFQPIPANTFVSVLFDKAQAKVKAMQEIGEPNKIVKGDNHENKGI
jgi:hypothetical protein